MGKKLLNLKPYFISLVSKKNKPINNEAKIVFIKSKGKDENNMELKNLVEKAKGLFGKEDVEEVEGDLEKRITKCEENLNNFIEEFRKFREELGNFVMEFQNSYSKDQIKLKEEIAQEIIKAKRVNSPVMEQPSLDEIIKKSSNYLFPIGQGNLMNDIISKGVQDKTLELSTNPQVTDSYHEAFKRMMGL